MAMPVETVARPLAKQQQADSPTVAPPLAKRPQDELPEAKQEYQFFKEEDLAWLDHKNFDDDVIERLRVLWLDLCQQYVFAFQAIVFRDVVVVGGGGGVVVVAAGGGLLKGC